MVGRCCRGAVIVDRGFERGGKVWGKMRLKCSRSDVGYLRQQANVAMLVVNAKMGMASDNTAPEHGDQGQQPYQDGFAEARSLGVRPVHSGPSVEGFQFFGKGICMGGPGGRVWAGDV